MNLSLIRKKVFMGSNKVKAFAYRIIGRHRDYRFVAGRDYTGFEESQGIGGSSCLPGQ